MKLYVGYSNESITLLKYMLKHRIKCQVFRVKKNVIVLELEKGQITGLNDVFNYLKDFNIPVEPAINLKESSSFEEASLKWMQDKDQDDVIHDKMNLDSKMEETMAARKGRTPAQAVKNNEPVINKPQIEETTFRKKPVSEIKDADDAMAQSLVNKILEQFDD